MRAISYYKMQGFEKSCAHLGNKYKNYSRNWDSEAELLYNSLQIIDGIKRKKGISKLVQKSFKF